MTWARLLATGQGKAEFRIAIEGCPIEFVTHARLKRTAIPSTDVTERANGLKRDGIRVVERLDIGKAEMRLDGMSLKIADIGGRATYAFARMPARVTHLLAEVNSTSDPVNVDVASTTGFSADDHININTESLRIASVTSGTRFSCRRAKYQTNAQKHFTENGFTMRVPEVTDIPPTLEGRRIWVYAYGENDSTSGDGSQIFLGVVRADPRLAEMGVWEIPVDGIDKLLLQDIGYDSLNPKLLPRGIYHSWGNPFVLYALEEDPGATYPIKLIDFYNDQDEFVAALDAALITETSTFTYGGTLRATKLDEKTVKIIYTTGPSTAAACVVALNPQLRDDFDNNLDGGNTYWYSNVNGAKVDNHSLSTNNSYYALMDSPCPRGVLYASYNTRTGTGYSNDESDPTQSALFPGNRFYFDGATNLAALPIVSAIVAGANVDVATSRRRNEIAPVWPTTWRVTNVEASERYVEFNPTDMINTTDTFPAGEGGLLQLWVPYETERPFEITLTSSTSTNARNVADFLDTLVDDSKDYINLGIMPFLTTDDYNQSLSEAQMDPAIANRTWARDRGYGLANRKSLAAIIAQELKLIACFPCLDVNGKIRIRKLTQPSSSAPTVWAITSANTLVSDPPKWERNALGLVNTFSYQGGYSFSEDKPTTIPITIRDVSGFGITRISKEMKVTPFSTDPKTISANDVETMSSEYFGTLGYPYIVINVTVPMTLFTSALVGTYGTIASNLLPDITDGTRGFSTALIGMVIGRDWDLARGQGQLEIYVPIARVSGYTPAVVITAASNTSGNNWTLTVRDYNYDDAANTTYYAENGLTTAYFPVGTRILIYQWDDDTPSTVAGVVTSVASTTIGVTTDGTWTTGGSMSATNAWVLGYNVASDSALTDAQKLYAYIAGSDMRIDFSTSQDAKVFSG